MTVRKGLSKMRRIACVALYACLACVASGCTAALTEQQLSGLTVPTAAETAAGAKSNGANSADITGSLPKPSRVRKIEGAGRTMASPDSADIWAKNYRPRTAEGVDQSPPVSRRLDEPSYRVATAQSANPLGNAAGPIQSDAPRTDALHVARETGPQAEAAPGRAPPVALSFRYSPDALELSDRDRQGLVEFAKHRSGKKMLVLTGVSAGQSPLETMLRAQERGRRLDALLRAHGEVEVKYDPGLARDVVRIEFDDV